jgi:hypothetical protein
MEEITKETTETTDAHAALEKRLGRVEQVLDGLLTIVDGLVSISVGNDEARTIRAIEALNSKMDSWDREDFTSAMKAAGYETPLDLIQASAEAIRVAKDETESDDV